MCNSRWLGRGRTLVVRAIGWNLPSVQGRHEAPATKGSLVRTVVGLMLHSLQHGGGDLCPFWPNVLVLQEILHTWYHYSDF